MSLIHEALKKAEQQRRLGQPPDLGTPFTTARRPRRLLPYLAAAITLALGAGWWLSRDPAPGTDDPAAAAAAAAAATAARDADKSAAPATTAAAPAGAAPVASSSAAERRPVMAANASANTDVADSVVPPPRLNNQAPNPAANPPTVKEVAERESEPHPPGANPLAPGETAPLTLGAPPPPTAVDDPAGLAQKQATKEREHAGRTVVGADAARLPRKPPQSTAEAVAEANRPPPPKPADLAQPKAPPSLPPPVAAPPAAAPAAAAAPPAPPLEQLPAYWQLPYNVRKELPELKLTMHVYSATPAQRFVVLNGNRLEEGKDAGGDVQVTEIRTDGVVLTYHGQRFLIPRGGS